MDASKGSSDEVVRQVRAEVFEPGQFATHVAANTATNMIGAALGARFGEIRTLNPGRSSNLTTSDTLLRPTKALTKAADATTQHFKPATSNQAQRNFSGSTFREYKMLGTLLPLAEMMATSKQASAVTRVREVKTSGELGPEQTLLIQHHDGLKTVSQGGVKINERLAAKADVIATCNPSCLPEVLRAKHVLSSAQETLWLTQIGDRLKFTTALDKSVGLASKLQPVALGEKSVSSLLLELNTRSMLRHKDTHDLGLYADVLRDFKIPA